MALHKKGTPVGIKRTLLTGTIKEAKIVDGDEVQYVVEYKDDEGIAQERAFAEDQLEVKGEAPAAPVKKGAK